MMELSHTCRVKDHVWNTPGYEPQDGEPTHSWQFQVRDRDADRMGYVDKVVVVLHDTFPEPRRVLTKQPFIVKEEGYATFEILVEIYFKGLPDTDKARKVTLLKEKNRNSPSNSILFSIFLDYDDVRPFPDTFNRSSELVPKEQHSQGAKKRHHQEADSSPP